MVPTIMEAEKSKPKIDPTVVDVGEFPVKAVALYPTKELYEQYISSRERGEHPKIRIVVRSNKKRGVAETYIVGSTDRLRLEKLEYFTIPPPLWKTDYSIIFEPETFKELCQKYLEALEIAKGKIAEMAEAEMRKMDVEFLEPEAYEEFLEGRIRAFFWWV